MINVILLSNRLPDEASLITPLYVHMFCIDLSLEWAHHPNQTLVLSSWISWYYFLPVTLSVRTVVALGGRLITAAVNVCILTLPNFIIQLTTKWLFNCRRWQKLWNNTTSCYYKNRQSEYTTVLYRQLALPDLFTIHVNSLYQLKCIGSYKNEEMWIICL